MRRTFQNRAIRFLKGESGPTAVEYAVMLALIILVCFTAIAGVGSVTNSHFNNVALKSSLSS